MSFQDVRRYISSLQIETALRMSIPEWGRSIDDINESVDSREESCYELKSFVSFREDGLQSSGEHL